MNLPLLLSLNMATFTLGRHERLRAEKAIALLFASGHSFSRYPIRLVWQEVSPGEDAPPPVRIMFSVSKKKFPRAVDRNRIKRLLREAYRLKKPQIFEKCPAGKVYHMALMYTAVEILAFDHIQKSVDQALERWNKSITNTPDPTPPIT